MRKELKIFLDACKTHSKKRKIGSQNKFMFKIKKILQVTKEIASIKATKNVQK